MEMNQSVMVLIFVGSWMCTDVTGSDSSLNTSALDTTNATCTLNSPFRCIDNVGCTTRWNFCNAVDDCSDRSDEVLYNQTIHGNLPGRKCGRWVNGGPRWCYIPEQYVCDTEIDCFFGNDECNCNTSFYCVGEPMKMCRVRVQFCDFKKDCYFQGSDEWKYAPGVPGFQCSVTKTHITNYCMLPTVHVCDGISDCDDGTDECFCSSSQTYDNTTFLNNKCFRCLDKTLVVPSKKICDGVLHCKDLSDECLCPNNRPSICEQVCKVGQNCGNCSVGQVSCISTNSSSTTKCINRTNVCDGQFDCPNQEDENNCEVIKSQTFTCADGKQYIPKYQRCDNYIDCSDKSDEIGCSSLYQCSLSKSSNDTNRPGGLLAISGNIAVIIHNAYQMKSSSEQINSLSFVNRILVSNLAVADLLLGIYLVSLGIANSTYQHIYCRKDIEWRGSSACVGLGCLAMISVEGSIFILTLMTKCRYNVILNPFDAKHRAWLIGVLLCCTWLLSMILAFVPLSYSAEDYFVSGLWYSNNPYVENPKRHNVEKFVSELHSLKNSLASNFTEQLPETFTWRSMIAEIANLRSTFLPQFNFGYYSAHGVCLPRLFPDPINDKSWGYSLFIIILNFVCFVYIAITYVAIYRKYRTSAKKAGRKDETTKTLQRKITRIVISNFCCWFPICVMAFISVSGIALSKEAYALAAIVLLPINSVANPFLYSSIPDALWEKIKQLQKLSGEPASSKSSLTERDMQGSQEMTTKTKSST